MQLCQEKKHMVKQRNNWKLVSRKKNRDKVVLASKIASKSENLEWIRRIQKFGI